MKFHHLNFSFLFITCHVFSTFLMITMSLNLEEGTNGKNRNVGKGWINNVCDPLAKSGSNKKTTTTTTTTTSTKKKNIVRKEGRRRHVFFNSNLNNYCLRYENTPFSPLPSPLSLSLDLFSLCKSRLRDFLFWGHTLNFFYLFFINYNE